MAKKPDNKAPSAAETTVTSTTTRSAETEATPEVVQGMPMSQMPEASTPEVTTLAPPAGSALAAPNSALAQAKALAARLPAKYRADVLMNPRPSPEDLVNIVLSLPDADQQKMLEIVKKANPKKQGAHSAKSSFAPTPIILFHGTGKDEARPRNTVPGHFYTKSSVIIGESFKGAVIAFFEGRIMWPPRTQGGGQAEGGKAPICVSFDRIEGSRYGECAVCPNADKPYNQGGCMREVTVYLIDEAMTGIFELKFAKSSEGAGAKLAQILQNSENIWDRWVQFESQERTKEDNRWFVIKAMPVQDTKNTANNVTPKHLHPLFSAMSRVIDHDVYYAGLADTYDRAKNSPDSSVNNGGKSAAGETVDTDSLLGSAAMDGDNPDYSSTKDV